MLAQQNTIIKNKFLRILLFPVALLYGFIIKIRNLLYDINVFSSTEFQQVVISVGNLTVGGTGKTPQTEYLINLLNANFNIAVLSRGYKRKTKGFVMVSHTTTSEEVGDEPKQIHSKFNNTKVAVCEKRVLGIKTLLEKDNKITAFILDDAYQHRKIKPSFSILLTDYSNLFYEDKFLPYGTLRDSVSQYRRANIIIVTKCPIDLKLVDKNNIIIKIKLMPSQSIYYTYIKYGTPLLCFNKIAQNESQIKIQKNKTTILIVSGIASSNSFVKHIREKISDKIIELNYPDHHSYNEKDIQKIHKIFTEIKNSDKIILTTEKDAVRLRDNIFIKDELKKIIFYLPIQTDFLFNSTETFNNQILNHVRKNQN